MESPLKMFRILFSSLTVDTRVTYQAVSVRFRVHAAVPGLEARTYR